jgi:hypothetical protein
MFKIKTTQYEQGYSINTVYSIILSIFLVYKIQQTKKYNKGSL